MIGSANLPLSTYIRVYDFFSSSGLSARHKHNRFRNSPEAIVFNLAQYLPLPGVTCPAIDVFYPINEAVPPTKSESTTLYLLPNIYAVFMKPLQTGAGRNRIIHTYK